MATKQPITLGKMRLLLRLMGLFQIPLLAFVKPRIIEINDEKCVVKVRNRRRVKNHLKSMYFGALCVGADVAGGLPVFYLCEQMGKKPSFAFKSVKANFLKRLETDAYFHCDQVPFIQQKINQALSENERQNFPVMVLVKDLNGEVFAEFEMELSVKVK